MQPGVAIINLALIVLLKGGSVKIFSGIDAGQIQGLLVEYAPVMDRSVARVTTERGFINFEYRVEGTKVVSVGTKTSVF